MEGQYRDEKRLCYSHPNELVIGVCALCLHQRLLLLQQNQHEQQHHISSSSSSSNSLHKVFALLNRLHIVRSQRRKLSDHHTAASISQQDSFISINLEDNSIASSSSWEKKAIVPKVSLKEEKKKDSVEAGEGLKTLVEQTKPQSSDPRWRKRIRHWLQLVRWKRLSSSKGKGCHVGSKVKKVKVIKHTCMMHG